MAQSRNTTPTDWSNIADWYDQLVGGAGSEFHQHVVLPGVTRLLSAQAGENVLDVACGQGILGRLLAAKGVKSLGFDAAQELITAARQHAGALPPEQAALATYKMLDAATDLETHLPVNAFDAAACVLALQNINPIQPVCKNVARALRPGGRFVIAMMHPCFRGVKESHWGWDDDAAVQYRRVDRYLIPRKAPIVAHPGRKQSHYTWTFHKPIESYVKALRNAGLLIDAMEEWPSHKNSQPGPRAAAENQARKEIPMFLAIRAIKVALPGQAADADADG
ncbi:MAG TPA: methyltransferase [Tepidisphaeraceae bacterium]